MLQHLYDAVEHHNNAHHRIQTFGRIRPSSAGGWLNNRNVRGWWGATISRRLTHTGGFRYRWR
jgi:hypothetical protein